MAMTSARWAVALAVICLGALPTSCEKKAPKPVNTAPVVVARPPHGWQAEGALELYGAQSLHLYIDGGAEFYLSYAFQGLQVQKYRGPDDQTITVELYNFANAEDAYGVFSWNRGGEPVVIGGAEARYGFGLVRLRKGKVFLRVACSQQTDARKEDVLAFAGLVAARLPEGLPTPALVRLLPSVQLDQRSIYYFHTKSCLDSVFFVSRDNILNLSMETEAITATYAPRGEGGRMLIIRYTAPPEAGSTLSSFLSAYFPEHPPSTTGILVAQVESEKFEGALREGPYLALAFDAPTRAGCEELLTDARTNILALGEGSADATR